MKKVFLIFLLLTFSILSYAPNTQISINSHNWPTVISEDHTNPNVYFLRLALRKMVECPYYQPHDHLTFCNVSAKDCLDDRPSRWFDGQYGFMLSDLHLDLTAIWPTIREMWIYDIKADYRAALRAIYQGRVEAVDCREAYELAKQGEVVFVISTTIFDRYELCHEAIVYPDMRPWNPDRGCTIAQCGRYCCITDISHRWTFGKYWRKINILFVWLRRRA